MRPQWHLALLILAVTLQCPPGVAAPPVAAPTTQADPNADRLTFLTLELSSAEESIKAVNAAMKQAGYKATVATDKAANYEKGNELMDRKGGGPVRWDEFYGRTARDFYAPQSWGTYHREGNGKTVDAKIALNYQPLKRPTQFDYLYRANSDQAAKANEQVAALGRQIDKLLARRRQLEVEQASLWTTIALESVGSRDVTFNPLYRLQLTAGKAGATTQPGDEAGVGILRPTVLFMWGADRNAARDAEGAQTDLSGALQDLKDQTAASEAALAESIFRVTQSSSLSADQVQQVKEIVGLGKRMNSFCKNAADAYRLSLDSDAAGDESRKQTLRGLLQESLMGFADAAIELDERLQKDAAAWGVRGEPGVANPELTKHADAESPKPAPLHAQLEPAGESKVLPTTRPAEAPQVATVLPPVAVIPPLPAHLQPGLVGEYYSGMNRDQLKVTRVDGAIDFHWERGQPPAEGCSTPKYSARWTGILVIPAGGAAGIGVEADDGAKLLIDGRELLSFARPHAEFIHGNLAAGPHAIELQYHNRLAGGACRLNWVLMNKPDQEQTVPANALFHSDASR